MRPAYTAITKQTDNPFLNMYKMDAVDRNGKTFGYYFATRKNDGELACQNKCHIARWCCYICCNRVPKRQNCAYKAIQISAGQIHIRTAGGPYRAWGDDSNDCLKRA